MYAVGAGAARPRIAYTPLLGRADPDPTVDVSLIDAFPLMLCQNAALPYFRRGLRGLHGSIFLLYPLKGMINPCNPRNPSKFILDTPLYGYRSPYIELTLYYSFILFTGFGNRTNTVPEPSEWFRRMIFLAFLQKDRSCFIR